MSIACKFGKLGAPVAGLIVSQMGMFPANWLSLRSRDSRLVQGDKSGMAEMLALAAERLCRFTRLATYDSGIVPGE